MGKRSAGEKAILVKFNKVCLYKGYGKKPNSSIFEGINSTSEPYSKSEHFQFLHNFRESVFNRKSTLQIIYEESGRPCVAFIRRVDALRIADTERRQLRRSWVCEVAKIF